MKAKKDQCEETVQQAHARIRAEAMAHFADRPHGANDRLEWIRKKMCDFKGMTYVPPEPVLAPVVKAEVSDPTVTLMGEGVRGAITESPDEGPEADSDEL